MLNKWNELMAEKAGDRERKKKAASASLASFGEEKEEAFALLGKQRKGEDPSVAGKRTASFYPGSEQGKGDPRLKEAEGSGRGKFLPYLKFRGERGNGRLGRVCRRKRGKSKGGKPEKSWTWSGFLKGPAVAAQKKVDREVLNEAQEKRDC